ncbi:MAG: stage III sporulation protein AG [Clostridiales bacterium]|nr:stage III sporulation protein AG [Clostridiales bacterium]
MDSNKIKNEIKKLLSDKKVSNVLAVLLIICFILIAINIISPDFVNASNKDNKTTNEEKTPISNSQYEELEKTELISILKKIDGVGEVEVKINFESDSVKVPAYESTKQNNTTEETDKEGGKRTNRQENDTSKVVMSDNEPYILQTYKPKVMGIVVVAEGANNSKVKHDIEVAVSNLYNLSANKVNVYSMK